MRRAMAVVLLLWAAGCVEQPAGGQRVVDATYTVRGEVAQIDGRSLTITHEAIDGFRDASGQVVGMVTMTMDFAVGDGVPLEGIAAGDKIEFEFEVWWKPAPGFQITSIKGLPADTELELGRAGEHEHRQH